MCVQGVSKGLEAFQFACGIWQKARDVQSISPLSPNNDVIIMGRRVVLYGDERAKKRTLTDTTGEVWTREEPPQQPPYAFTSPPQPQKLKRLLPRPFLFNSFPHKQELSLALSLLLNLNAFVDFKLRFVPSCSELWFRWFYRTRKKSVKIGWSRGQRVYLPFSRWKEFDSYCECTYLATNILIGLSWWALANFGSSNHGWRRIIMTQIEYSVMNTWSCDNSKKRLLVGVANFRPFNYNER